MAVTLVDSLDTLWLVGLQDEFRGRATSWRRRGRKLARPPSTASVFETTIRVLGGLLGAYELSQAPSSRRAPDRRRRLREDRPGDGQRAGGFGGRAGSCPSLAHAGTVQLEMLYLSESRTTTSTRRAGAFYEFQRRQPSLGDRTSASAAARAS